MYTCFTISIIPHPSKEVMNEVGQLIRMYIYSISVTCGDRAVLEGVGGRCGTRSGSDTGAVPRDLGPMAGSVGKEEGGYRNLHDWRRGETERREDEATTVSGR